MSTHGWPEESNAEQAESLIQSRDWWKRRWTESQDRIRALEAALREAIAYVELDSETPYPMMADWKRALATLETFAEPAIDQAPIARVIVTDDAPAGVVLYAPGLPPGEFDVYLEPTKGEQG